MPLKVDLKPDEQIIIGSVVVRNGATRAQLFIEGRAPILREKDILTPATANSPARRIYLAVQMMYLREDVAEHRKTYADLAQAFLEAAPSALPQLRAIDSALLAGTPYKALKAARALIAFETPLLALAAGRR